MKRLAKFIETEILRQARPHLLETTLGIRSGEGCWFTLVSWFPDGKRPVSGSEEHMVKVWDAANGQQALTIDGHPNSVTDVGFSPDENALWKVFSWGSVIAPSDIGSPLNAFPRRLE